LEPAINRVPFNDFSLKVVIRALRGSPQQDVLQINFLFTRGLTF